MERGAEPWSWVLETSSAGSHDFYPGVGLRRESPPPHAPPGSLFSLPWQGRVQNLPAVQDKRMIHVCAPEWDLGHGLPPSPFPAQAPKETPRFPRTYLHSPSALTP